MACMLAKSLNEPSTPEASVASLPQRLLRLLPAGTIVAGRDSHPLKNNASSQRTSTNPIENMFSTVRDCETNIKRYRGSTMSQRWLAAVLLHCERGFRKIKGYKDIFKLIESIESYCDDQGQIAA